jgi:hypothetical protein
MPNAYNGEWFFTSAAKKTLNFPSELCGTVGMGLSALNIILKNGANALIEINENKVARME